MSNDVGYVMRPWDIVVFDGGGTEDLVGLAKDALPNIIEADTASLLSHAAMVAPPELLPRGQIGVWILESTILAGRNGPQLNPLDARVADHRRSWWLPLDDPIRRCLDTAAMVKLAQSKIGKDTYNVGGLFRYAASKIPLVNRIPALSLYKPDQGTEYCSELCAEELQAGGVHFATTQISPQTLAEMRIYRTCVQLAGPPATIRNFNTV